VTRIGTQVCCRSISDAIPQENKTFRFSIALEKRSRPLAAGRRVAGTFRELHEIPTEAGLSKFSIVSGRLHLQDVLKDIAVANKVYKEYLGDYPPSRRAQGVALQSGMLIEAAFVAEANSEAPSAASEWSGKVKVIFWALALDRARLHSVESGRGQWWHAPAYLRASTDAR
jgi:hypothetical protein